MDASRNHKRLGQILKKEKRKGKRKRKTWGEKILKEGWELVLVAPSGGKKKSNNLNLMAIKKLLVREAV